MKLAVLIACGGIVAGIVACSPDTEPGHRELLNVSYDPTRELYVEFNQKFAEFWLEQSGEKISVHMSHGGSGSQARSVIDGLAADVVSLALAYDVEAIRLLGHRLNPGWQSRLPDNSAPYTSTIVFLVREGNPKQINDWPDLVREGVEIITPNPKTSGGARWNYLAAWGFKLQQELAGSAQAGTPTEEELTRAQQVAGEFVGKLFRQVPVLDRGARASTNTFVQRGIGDVLLAWENEALLALAEAGEDKFDIVYPSASILAEPTVAVIDAVVERKGSRDLAQAYLEYLYTPVGQDIVARHYFRPRDPEVAAQHRDRFPEISMFTIQDVFGGWEKAQAEHFDDGGKFDQIYEQQADTAEGEAQN